MKPTTRRTMLKALAGAGAATRRLRLPLREPAGPRPAAASSSASSCPMTGPMALEAQEMLAATQIAVEDVNADGRRHGPEGRDGHPRLRVQARGGQAQGHRADRGGEGAVPGRRHRGLRGHRDGRGRLQERRDRQLLRPELPDRQGQDVQVPVRQQPHALPDRGRRRPLRGRPEDGQEVAHARQQLLVAADVRARVLAGGQAGRRRVDGRDVGAARHARLPAVPAQGGRGQGRRRLHHDVGRRPGGVRQAGAGVRPRQAVAGHPLHHRAHVRGGRGQGRLRELLLGHAVVLAPQGQVPGGQEVLRPPLRAPQARALAGTPRPPTPRCACSSTPRAR